MKGGWMVTMLMVALINGFTIGWMAAIILIAERAS